YCLIDTLMLGQRAKVKKTELDCHGGFCVCEPLYKHTVYIHMRVHSCPLCFRISIYDQQTHLGFQAADQANSLWRASWVLAIHTAMLFLQVAEYDGIWLQIINI